MRAPLLILLFFTFSFGYSQDWKFMYEQDGETFYFKLHNDELAWIKIVSDNIEYYLNKTTEKKSYVDGYQLQLWKFDCRAKKLGVVQQTIYSKDGKVLSTYEVEDYMVNMTYVIPDSLGEGMIRFFCEE